MSLTLIVLGSYIAGALSVIAGVWCAVAWNQRRTDVPLIRHAEWVDTPDWCCSRYADCRLCPNTTYHHPDAQRSEATN